MSDSSEGQSYSDLDVNTWKLFDDKANDVDPIKDEKETKKEKEDSSGGEEEEQEREQEEEEAEEAEEEKKEEQEQERRRERREAVRTRSRGRRVEDKRTPKYRDLLIQVVSDLHLCVSRPKYSIEPHADYLLVCGDTEMFMFGFIHLKKFLKQVSKKFLKVFWILGNHESIAVSVVSLEEIISRCYKMARQTGTIFLNNDMAPLNDKYNVIGTPLYSYIPEDYTQRVTHKKPFTQFLRLKNMGGKKTLVPRTINREGFNELHEEAKQSIIRCLNQIKAEGKKAIVMTHYGALAPVPTYQMRNHWMNHVYIHYSIYNTDEDMQDVLAAGKGVLAVWAYGHDHINRRVTIGDIGYTLDMVSNQLGHVDEKGVAASFLKDYTYLLEKNYNQIE